MNVSINCKLSGNLRFMSLTNIDIEKLMKDEPNFKGVFAIDTLPNKAIGCGVINYDTIGGKGTHWTCYFNDPKSKFIEHLDSFGLPPSETMKTFLKTSGKQIVYNDSQLQSKNSVLCGYYCIHYIKERNKCKSPYEVLYSFKQQPSEYNERKVLTGSGLDNTKIEKLKSIYFDAKQGFSGINDLTRKSGLKQSEVKQFLDTVDTYTLHKPIRKKFETRRVFVSDIDKQFQADLVEMQQFEKENKGFKYLLTVIDCFSKYAWAVPIKNKTADETIKAFEVIFKERKPAKLQTDKGKEFINKKFQDVLKLNNIHWFSTNSDLKASIVERFNRTLKTKMWRLFTEIGNNKWIDVIDDLVYNYNNSYHSSIKMTPIQGSMTKNKDRVYHNLYGKSKQIILRTKFKEGDKIRISKWKGTFAKGYLPNYKKELFTISKVLNTVPVTYKVQDLNGEQVEGMFYEPELVKFDKQDEDFEVEKILDTRIRNGKKEHLIKWLSYGPEFNSWELAENVKN